MGHQFGLVTLNCTLKTREVVSSVRVPVSLEWRIREGLHFTEYSHPFHLLTREISFNVGERLNTSFFKVHHMRPSQPSIAEPAPIMSREKPLFPSMKPKFVNSSCPISPEKSSMSIR